MDAPGISLLASSFLTSFSRQFPDITFHNSCALFLRQKAKLGAKPTEHMPNAEGEMLFHLLHAFVAKVVILKQVSTHCADMHVYTNRSVERKPPGFASVSLTPVTDAILRKHLVFTPFFSSSHVHKALL